MVKILWKTWNAQIRIQIVAKRTPEDGLYVLEGPLSHVLRSVLW
jgi:hypothetical protein